MNGPIEYSGGTSIGGGLGGWGGWGGGIGGVGLVGLIGLNNLFGRRDGGDCDQNNIFSASVLKSLGDIEAAVPAAASGLKDTIQNQTLWQSGSFAGVKDSVQGTYAGLSAQICDAKTTLLQAIDAEGDSIKGLITQNRISQLETELLEERSGRRSRDVEVNVTQNVNQAQVQMQQQQQIQSINENFRHLLGLFSNQFQQQRATAGSVQFGTGNVAANTPTNTANQVGGF